MPDRIKTLNDKRSLVYVVIVSVYSRNMASIMLAIQNPCSPRAGVMPGHKEERETATGWSMGQLYTILAWCMFLESLVWEVEGCGCCLFAEWRPTLPSLYWSAFGWIKWKANRKSRISHQPRRCLSAMLSLHSPREENIVEKRGSLSPWAWLALLWGSPASDYNQNREKPSYS